MSKIQITNKSFVPGQPEQIDDSTGEVLVAAVPDQWDVMAHIQLPGGSMTSSFLVEGGPDADEKDLAETLARNVGLAD